MKNHYKAVLGASAIALFVGSMPQIAMAQEKTDTNKDKDVIIVTGSSIKRKVFDSATPIQIITKADLERDGVVTAEQFIQLLNSNGNGTDNLQSNNDVIDNTKKSYNGMSAANLRGQGAGSTLILLNGRRVAAYGLNGGVVDVSQIPMAAIERIDVLKDGASAIYGTDAIGGVINYITKKNYQGGNINLFADKTQEGGGDIYRASLAYGIGNLNEDKYNIMVSASYTENKILEGRDRDFTNGFQPSKGMSIDTGGTPFATIFTTAASTTIRDSSGNLVLPKGTLFAVGDTGVSPNIPGTGLVTDGVNVLDLPGGAGCNTYDLMAPYDELIFNAPRRAYRCAWDTAASAAILQPSKKENYIAKGTFKFGNHELSIEAMTSHSEATKKFSNYQLSSSVSATGFNGFFPLISNATDPNHGYTKDTYDRIYNALVAVYPTISSNYGDPMALRWRCDVCGRRELNTVTDSSRFLVGLDGDLGDTDWNYRVGASLATSESESTLVKGYYYQKSNPALGIIGLENLLNDGYLNPFLLPGQTQSAKAMELLRKASADGYKLFGGKFTMTEIDGSVSGPLINLPGGMAYAAVGFDLRQEKFEFNGEKSTIVGAPAPYLAPTDSAAVLDQKTRAVNAVFAELALPLFKGFELTLAGRLDDYTGFGTTTNPKVSFKYRPFDPILFRGSYNTSFRVPSFGQVFSGTSLSPLTDPTYADPKTCPGGVASSAPGCEAIGSFDQLTGGKIDLKPETATQYSLGVVLSPAPSYNISIDWWRIEKEGTIDTFQPKELFSNYEYFPERFIRDSTGKITAIDRRIANMGASLTEGLDIAARANGTIWNGKWSVGLDGSYLIEKKTQRLPNAPWGPSEIGYFTDFGDLGIEWKHSIFVSYSKNNWTGALTQIFRSGYDNKKLAGVAAGAVKPSDLVDKVDDYIIYNANVTYKGFKNFTIAAGVKNILDTDPPFAITYNADLGSGGAWEPRVADPRGRAFTLALDYSF